LDPHGIVIARDSRKSLRARRVAVVNSQDEAGAAGAIRGPFEGAIGDRRSTDGRKDRGTLLSGNSVALGSGEDRFRRVSMFPWAHFASAGVLRKPLQWCVLAAAVLSANL
jgi:hypothetical protein